MRKFTFLMLLIGVAHGTTGCTNTVTGTIDGLSLPAMQSAFYIEAEDGYGEDGTLIVWLSTVPNACEVTETVLAGQAATDDPSELADLWSSHYPEDFWEVTVVIRAADIDDSAVGARLNGVPWDVDNGEAGDAFASFTHFLGAHDEDFWNGSGSYDRYQDLYYSDRGDLEIDIHSPGARIGGYFDADVTDWDDGDLQGEVSINFDAQRCRGVERVFFASNSEPADDATADEPPADEPPADEPPADEPPADERPDERPPA